MQEVTQKPERKQNGRNRFLLLRCFRLPLYNLQNRTTGYGLKKVLHLQNSLVRPEIRGYGIDCFEGLYSEYNPVPSDKVLNKDVFGT